jgi:hypothetical protein
MTSGVVNTGILGPGGGDFTHKRAHPGDLYMTYVN